MRPFGIVSVGPAGHGFAGVVDPGEQRFVQESVPHPPLNASQFSFCMGLPGAM